MHQVKCSQCGELINSWEVYGTRCSSCKELNGLFGYHRRMFINAKGVTKREAKHQVALDRIMREYYRLLRLNPNANIPESVKTLINK